MKKQFSKQLFFFSFSVVLLLLTGCPTQTAQIVDPEPQEIPEEEPKSVDEETPVEETPAEESSQDSSTGEYVVSEEVYERTFDEIENLINNLNDIIKKRNFDLWETFLTDAYIAKVTDPENLARISNQPTLKKYSITIQTLQDYFRYVVAPSRSNSRVDEIIFQNDNHIKAITLVNGRRSILYYLVKVDGQWKIGTGEQS